ncbi:MAG: hypothetical protein JSV45_10105 [Chromatiales bacterium]|nr:MAG: hypothetical protein JSV45_10105 [Chromatiales bacterium]
MKITTETLCAGAVVLGSLGGCGLAAKAPGNELRLEESTLEIRSLQSRTFAASSETEILAATIAVLQDMEYNVDRVESPLGVITASKVADADSANEQFGLFMVDLLCVLGGSDCGAMDSASDEQLITLTLVVQPSLANTEEYVARVTLQRVVYDTLDRVKVREEIHESEMYQQIFERLSKSIFLQVET